LYVCTNKNVAVNGEAAGRACRNTAPNPSSLKV
jgi:hypothetical protein